MNNFVLFCKTYKNDFERFRILKDSIDKFNIENIPFYVVCPEEDKELFSTLFNGNELYENHIITDEKIFEILQTEKQAQNWSIQGIIKFGFYKLNVCNFFLIIDSDSYFIRDFKISDFMYDENTPYIVIHEGKDAKLINESLGSSNIYDLENAVKKYFKRDGKNYRFLTTPIVFSCKVLENLEKFAPFKELLKISPIEATWHGEYLLYSNIIKYKQSEPFFKTMVYQTAYNLYSKNLKISEKEIAEIYFGLVMQSGHVNDMKYKSKSKNIFLNLIKYKILSKITFFGMRKKYKIKYKQFKGVYDKN